MNAIQEARKEGLVSRFLSRSGLARSGLNLRVLENPTDELDHAFARGKGVKVFGAGIAAGASRDVRVEENYLYSTRRFPLNTANDTIGAGALAAADYDFFGNGVGDTGTAMGYASLATLSYLQTNMEKGGKIPKGKGYKLYELAVSFSAESIGADIAQMLDVCNLRFDKGGGNFIVQHGPVALWPAGVGVTGYAATTATTTTLQAATSGLPTLASVRRMRNPRILEPNDTFKYTITAVANRPRTNVAVALSAFVEMRIWLFGYTFDVPAQ